MADMTNIDRGTKIALSNRSNNHPNHRSDGASEVVIADNEAAKVVTAVTTINMNKEGGWGYIIVASVFVVNMALLGWFQCQTFFFVEWQREFRSTSVEASVLVSIGLVVFGLFSPLGSILSAWIGPRVTVMSGGLLVTLGMIGTMFMESIVGIILTWGAITGFGFALVYSPSVSMISQYFDKHFTIANGVAYAGAACGQIFVPLLADGLINAYGWRGTMLILAATMSHLIACGAVLIPKNKKQPTGQTKNNLDGDNTYANKAYVPEPAGADSKPNKTDNTLDGDNLNDNYAYASETKEIYSKNGSANLFQDEDLGDKSAAYVKNNSDAYLAGALSSDTVLNDKLTPPTSRSEMDSTRTVQLIITSLVRNVSFDIVLIVFFLQGFLFYTPVAHTLPIALRAGISASKGALLPTFFGVGSIFGRLVPSFMADFYQYPRDIIAIIAFVICAFGNTLMPLFNAFGHFVIYHLIYGCVTGTLTVFTYTIVQVILPAENRGFGVGLATFFFAIGDATGSICAGWMVDVSGSYKTALWSLAGLAVVAASLLVYVAILTRRNKENSQENNA